MDFILEYEDNCPIIFANPINITTETSENNTNCIEMIKYKLPTAL